MAIRQLKPNEIPSVLKQLVTKQGNKCGICGHPFTVRDRPVLDHDHDTGFIRGVLHNSCNGTEGRIKSKAYLGHTGISPAKYVIGLGKYLEKHSTPQLALIHPTHLSEEDKRIKRNAKARDARARKVRSARTKA